MPHITPASLPGATRQPPVRRSFSFTCSCCDLTEMRPEPTAPAGWVILYTDDTAHVFCPPCAQDVPAGDIQ